MKIIRSISEMQTWSAAEQRAGKSIGFVPTMGALHSGHAKLFSESVTRNQRTVVSIFVNSLQFNNASDLDAYPRQLEQDRLVAEHENVDVIFAPSHEEMYPEGFSSIVSAGSIAEHLEGLHRPGHFDGVATIVVKLLNAVRPNIAYFGQKDFQQLAVIRQVVRDLNIDCTIESVLTVRDHRGLALSSRNARLSPEHLAEAPSIYVHLRELVEQSRKSDTTSESLKTRFLERLHASTSGVVEYLEVVDTKTLLSTSHVTAGCTICVAVWFGEVRLIDNISVGPFPD
jgi:pantoate--beta-alanine ligase